MLLPNYPGKTGGFAPKGNTINSAFSFRFQTRIWDYIYSVNFLFNLNFMCMGVFCLYVKPLCHLHAWCLWRQEEGVGVPGTAVREGREPPCGSWELNPDPLGEQSALISFKTIFG